MNSLLKKYIQLILEQEYGQYLFGADRGYPEEDTPDEKKALDALKQHYNHNMNAFSPYAVKFKKLKDKGEYQDVLTPPQNVKMAYRFLTNISAEVLSEMSEISVEQINSQRGTGFNLSGGVYVPKGKIHSSWTTHNEKRLLKRITYNLAETEFRDFICVLEASVAENKDKFILNPDEMAKIKDIAGIVKSEKEIVSVGSVILNRIICYGAPIGTTEDVEDGMNKLLMVF